MTEDEPGAAARITTKADGPPTAEAAAASTEAQPPAGPAAGGGRWEAVRRALGRTWVRHLILILVYQGAGIAATWPRFTWLADGKLPATSDVSTFVWNSGGQNINWSICRTRSSLPSWRPRSERTWHSAH